MAKNGKKNANRRTGLIAALDLGTAKTACFVARFEEDGTPQIVGVGQRATQGLRAGGVVDVNAARDTIVNTVHLAEEMAGDTVRAVVVNLSCGLPRSERFPVEASIAGHEVTASDVRRVLEQGRQYHTAAGYEMVHSIPVGFRVDAQGGIRDPRGLYGETLGVDMHVVEAEAGPVRTLATVLAGCHLDIEAFVVSPYASGLACLVRDEMELGACIVDMGAGVTSIAVFEGGELIHTATVPVGGGHVTTDIAQGLSTPIAQAERMKLVHGSALAQPEDKRVTIEVPRLGDVETEPANQMPKSVLTGIIQPRLEETFELVRGELEHSGVSAKAARQVVVTGGASLLPRTRDLAARILDRNVRMGRPHRHNGLAEAASGPAFATCAGLIDYARRVHGDPLGAAAQTTDEKRGMFGRLGSWLHEHL